MSESSELFEAFGLRKLDNGLWRYVKDYRSDPEATENPDRIAVLIVEERPDGSFAGHVPFNSYCHPDLAEIPQASLFFVSSDPRDMVALAQNEAGSAYCEATGRFPDEGFSDDEASGMFITFPYMSDPWGDYAVVPGTKQEAPRYELVSPADVFSGYVEWRDDFCRRIQAAAPSGPAAT